MFLPAHSGGITVSLIPSVANHLQGSLPPAELALEVLVLVAELRG
jgi:hypothetical protein